MNSYIVKKVKHPTDILTRVPGSKSITNRALLLAALAEGETILNGVLFSDDSRYFMQALRDLGFSIAWDEKEEKVTVLGGGGGVPCAGLRKEGEVDASLYIGSSGIAARFLTAYLGLSQGRYRIDASEQMRKRPMKELLLALEEMGVSITYEEKPYHFPFVIGDFCSRRSEITIDIDKSSQFLSALLIVSVLLPRDYIIRLSGSHGMDYVWMTIRMMEQFGITMRKSGDAFVRQTEGRYRGCTYEIEPDVSGACYFYAMAPLLGISTQVYGVHKDSLQGDIKFLYLLQEMGCHLTEDEKGIILAPPKERLQGGCFDLSAFSDQALTLAAIAPFADCPVRIQKIGHIRYQECDRIEAILCNLSKMGISAVFKEDSVWIEPGMPKGCRIRTFEDHRVAMAFALPGLVTGEMEIENPSCTRKTFENYFETLERAVYTEEDHRR